MRIAVFCSASTKIDQKYIDFGFEVGKSIAEQGWDVAWTRSGDRVGALAGAPKTQAVRAAAQAAD